MAGDLDVWGHWYTPDGASIITIEDCGDGTPCGRVAWVDAEQGGMTEDVHNHDKDLRGRAMLGITLLSGFEERRDRWRRGSIYNPKDGRTYRARLRLLSQNVLGVSGCLGPVCKELTWERAPESQAAGTAPAREAQLASR
ncbi:DUF2147 domain-containing protein [Parvularcula maris]|uniref:DUF2147 domain-containing protein n=1 Tax=Parvularcula maris TaxID=2965077 RepID=A0A9X2LBI3_9PROT|nr:DUF2147 domain-containing protein [Parvularcula maris]MCQ8186536.1 DUF2147 domain-containing protein [Parvularcula maris]